MSWRTVVITGVAKLDYKMGYLVVRRQDDIKNIFIDEINILMIESTTISLTATLLSKLIKSKVDIVFCDEKHNPESQLIPLCGSYDTSYKIRNQIKWTEENKRMIWTEIVTEKIRNQMRFLKYLHCNDKASILQSYINEIQEYDSTNREGHAAKVYFNTLFGLGFSREKENPINSCLDYGYSVLLSYFTREIIANGYITQIGLFHDNVANPYNLASDLMEPFRIAIDRIVVDIDPEKFENDEKIRILNTFNQEVIITDKVTSLDQAIKIYCRSVFDALMHENKELINFYYYEL